MTSEMLVGGDVDAVEVVVVDDDSIHSISSTSHLVAESNC